jgi:DNA mismatch repair protein MutS
MTLSRTADALAELDVLAGWAVLAREWDYCRPQLDDGEVLSITDGRHPVVEQMMKQERLGLAGSYTFVPNDTALSADDAQILLITGPNMAGKSTYIRQVALITLSPRSAAGCPPPCRLGLVDRIFTRVGASDDLAAAARPSWSR